MIKKIDFCINHSSKIKSLYNLESTLDFKPGYNVIIGPNGSGKTTILEAIAQCPLCNIQKDRETKVKYITTEELTPTLGGKFTTRESMVMGIRALFNSHGENVRMMLENQKYRGENCFLIDTPETGQDLENSQKIFEAFMRISKKYQVIVVTHSLTFLQYTDNLIELKPNYLNKILRTNEKFIEKMKK